MTQAERELRDAIADRLEDMRELLPDGLGDYRLTFMARIPGNDEADIVVTQDFAQDLAEMADRAAERGEK